MTNKILDYWDDPKVESMPDKTLLGLEIGAIRDRISRGAHILDVGCGEGEGTAIYSSVEGVSIDAIDFSNTRLQKASATVKECGQPERVTFIKLDITSDGWSDALTRGVPYYGYDIIISQRCLINLDSWEAQAKAINDLLGLLSGRGKLLLLEGSAEGAYHLNVARGICGLPEIPIRWHNKFLRETDIAELLTKRGSDFAIKEISGFGNYFLLTRVAKPLLLGTPGSGEDKFNKNAAGIENLLHSDSPNLWLSREKLWTIQRP